MFVSAESLHSRKVGINSQTYFSPHGVDVELFGRVSPFAGNTAPSWSAVGFFGLIEEWIDLELIDFLAEQRPNDVLFIGRVAECGDFRYDRTHVGKRPYARSACGSGSTLRSRSADGRSCTQTLAAEAGHGQAHCLGEYSRDDNMPTWWKLPTAAKSSWPSSTKC